MCPAISCATWRGSRLPDSSALMSSSRRSSPARSCVRVSSRADPTAIAAWSARIVSSRRSSDPKPSSPSFESVITPVVTSSWRIGTTSIDSSISSVPSIDGATRVAVRVVDHDRLAVLGDPAGEPFAEPAGQQRHVDLLVGADAALEGDRHHPVGRLEEIDPGVVVVDDPAGLLDDDPADLLDADRAAHPCRGGLQHLELGGAPLGLLEQLGVGDGDRGVRRQGRDERHVAAGPGTRLTGDGGQRPDDPIVVRRAGRARWPAISKTSVVALVGERSTGPRCPATARTWPLRSTSPIRPSSRPRTASCRARSSVSPAQAATSRRLIAQDPDRGGVRPQGALRLVDDHPEQLRAVVGCGQPPGDVEDRVEALRPARPPAADRPTSSRRRRSVALLRAGVPRGDEPSPDRAAVRGSRCRACSGRPPTTRFGPGRISAVPGRARTSRWSHRRRPFARPPSVPVTGQDHRPRRVDHPDAPGLHSGGVATFHGPGRPSPLRGPHTLVDDGPSPIGADRGVITRFPVRPAR